MEIGQQMSFSKYFSAQILVIFIISMILFTSCDILGFGPNNEQEGTLIVKITDSPFPISLISEANVTIEKIEIRSVNDTASNPYIILSEDTSSFNLINLRNGITEELLKLDLPIGTYDLIRLYVSEPSILLNDGQEFGLKVPSGAESGIKVFINPAIVILGGSTTELLIDFDLSNSFVVQGNPDTPAGIKGFHFKPVIRAVNNTEAGSILGSVADTSANILSDAIVWMEQDTVISSTYTDETGAYALIGLPPGIYSIFATKSGYDTVSYPNIEILNKSQISQDFMLSLQ